MNTLSNAFLPKFIKEVLTHIPTLALKSMDWKGIIKELGPMVGRLGKRQLDEQFLDSIRELEVSGLELSADKVESNFSNLDEEGRAKVAETILRLFFSQLKNETGLNMDLRPKHFRSENQLIFAPNNFWFQFDEGFRLALIDLYKGFYFEEVKLFDRALSQIGLVKDLEPDQALRLTELFREHFGPGDQREVLFKLEHFKESFYELFKFFMDHEVELDKDFMFLGVYLVGLYMSLEKLGVAVDVRKVFLQVFRAE